MLSHLLVAVITFFGGAKDAASYLFISPLLGACVLIFKMAFLFTILARVLLLSLLGVPKYWQLFWHMPRLTCLMVKVF